MESSLNKIGGGGGGGVEKVFPPELRCEIVALPPHLPSFA